MADLFDPFGLVFEYVDADTRMNLDLVPLADGAVQVRIFAPGKATTTRSVVLDAGATQRLQLALAWEAGRERAVAIARAYAKEASR